MAKKAMVLKQQRTPKYSTRAYNRCKSVEDLMLISESSVSAVYASGNWHTKVKSPELKRLVGKIIAQRA